MVVLDGMRFLIVFPSRAIDQLSHITQEAFQFFFSVEKIPPCPITIQVKRWKKSLLEVVVEEGLLWWLSKRDSQTVKFKGGISWTRFLRLAVVSPPHLESQVHRTEFCFCKTCF